MKKIFDQVSKDSATLITKKYSTSFSIAVSLLDSSIRQDIYNIYGFVRVADEIVDSFDGFPQHDLLNRFEIEYDFAALYGISTNPILNAFQQTVEKYNIDPKLIKAFLKSMRADLTKKVYLNEEELNDYIYGSADVVGLMCLKVFVKGDQVKYNNLKKSAIKLGSAFQKVNFLRDLKNDYENLNRIYFPDLDPNNFSDIDKDKIVSGIKEDFRIAREGIHQLPREARLGVQIAYTYYSRLLDKILQTPASALKEKRISVSNSSKMLLLIKTYMGDKFKLI